MKETHQFPFQSSFLALSPSITIKKAIKNMVKTQTSCALITEEQKLLGIFTERDIVKITINITLFENLTLGEVMTTKVITVKVSEAEDIFVLSKLFQQHHIRHLPVVNDQNEIIGVITPHSLRNILKPEHLLRYVRVQEIMNNKVIYGLPNNPILVLAQKNDDPSC